ncbi:nicotinamide riboside transporter PnuC [Hoylesella oralis]|uniref:nicotinamide riboside transporter PnuC n=1 Tax=Hoylesella oralis TaxID=28134 RepID=UPI0028EAA322|nr:nicotinamide riboside transporter PnuC [Hoylesella oralis]
MADIQTFLAEHWLDMLSTVLGIIYIILEYKAHIALWLVGIVMPAIDIYLFWSVGLYADFGMAIYYTFAALYGYAVWKFGRKKNQKANEQLPITHFKRSLILPSVLVFLAAWLGIYEVLIHFTNSDVPVIDSFINALSFIGLWALARKYLEQWAVWIVVDAVSAALYAYKGIPFKAGLYALYVVIAVMGYCKWRKMLKENR